jgi:putative hydroxymethylpyrimidine transport system substrate-binding protein
MEITVKKIITLFLLLLSSICFAQDPKPQKLKIILDWFPNPDHAPLMIAEQQGYFRAERLDVELVGPADPTDAPKLVAAKQADLGISYQPELVEYTDQGLPLVRVGTLIDKPLDCIVALESSGIKDIGDLKGKRIGVGSGAFSNLMLKTILQKAGLKENEVELVNVHYNLTQALLTRKVDAVAGVMRNIEVPMLEAKGQKVVVFFPEEHGIPNYSVLVFIAHKDNIKDPRLPRFLAAIKKAVRYLDEHPKEAWEQFTKHYPESNNEVNREAWFITLPYFAEEPSELNKPEWERFAQFMYQNKMIKKVHPLANYAVEIS